MKARICLLLYLLAGTALSARINASPDCRTLTAYHVVDSNISSRIEADLLSGVWTEYAQIAGVSGRINTLLQFTAEGKADMLQRNALGGYATESLRWKVEMQNGQAVLRLSGQAGAPMAYQLQPTCDGIRLVSLESGEVLDLEHNAPVRATELRQLRTSIIGGWSNTLYPFEQDISVAAAGRGGQIDGAFLHYEFRPDGTYVKALGSREKQIKESGVWEISKDGAYLLMHHQDASDGQTAIQTQMARIKYLQFDELVLEHALRVNEAQFCTRRKDFFFNKS